MNNLSITHILYIKDFFEQVECLKNPQYRSKPLVIKGGVDGKNVAWANTMAKRWGYQAGNHFIPTAGLVVLEGDSPLYTKFYAWVEETLQSYFPYVRGVGPDCFGVCAEKMEGWMDLNGYLQKAVASIYEQTGLRCSFGKALNQEPLKAKPEEISATSKIMNEGYYSVKEFVEVSSKLLTKRLFESRQMCSSIVIRVISKNNGNKRVRLLFPYTAHLGQLTRWSDKLAMKFEKLYSKGDILELSFEGTIPFESSWALLSYNKRNRIEKREKRKELTTSTQKRTAYLSA